jgi:hypothetical protein
MVEAARACVQLRRQHHELEVRLIAGAYRSFALSIGPGGPLRVNQLRASLPLFRVRPIRKRVGPALQLFYQHYALHYWTKVGEIAAQVLSSLFGSLGVWAGRIALERCAERLEACLETALALEVPDLEAAADVESLHAEVRTILRQEAVSLAERNRQIRAALGTLNRVALVDRQLGWAYLSEDTNQRREDAIRAFARGLWLSTYSWDGSIEPKLAADLVRALHSKQAKELDNLREGSACEGSACDEKSAVLDTCRQVGLGERPVCDLIAEDCRRMLVRHLRFLYAPDDTKILERISRLTDTARYPIFLAPDPPAAAIERRRRCRNHAETSPSDSAP